MEDSKNYQDDISYYKMVWRATLIGVLQLTDEAYRIECTRLDSLTENIDELLHETPYYYVLENIVLRIQSELLLAEDRFIAMRSWVKKQLNRSLRDIKSYDDAVRETNCVISMSLLEPF